MERNKLDTITNLFEGNEIRSIWDGIDLKEAFRSIQSIPSKKAEPYKLWLAQIGKERIDEIFNPELAVNRVVDYYRRKRIR